MNWRERIKEKICPVCHKRFIPATYHTYKTPQKRACCSWGCQLISEEGIEVKKVNLDDYSNTQNLMLPTEKQYIILAKREEDDDWSMWAEADDYDRATHHFNYCQGLGYISKIIKGNELWELKN